MVSRRYRHTATGHLQLPSIRPPELVGATCSTDQPVGLDGCGRCGDAGSRVASEEVRRG